jgi:membrane protein
MFLVTERDSDRGWLTHLTTVSSEPNAHLAGKNPHAVGSALVRSNLAATLCANFWKKRLIAIITTLVSAIFFLAIFGLGSVSRGAAGMLSDHLRALAVSKAAWEIARWLANLLLILLAINLANYFLPDAKRPCRWLTPGTSFVALTFVLSSVVFNVYIRHSPNIPRVYGTLAGFIVFMMWIYMANLILLIGAETDTAIEEMQRKELTA